MTIETWLKCVESLAAKAKKNPRAAFKWLLGVGVSALGVILMLVIKYYQSSAASAKADLAVYKAQQSDHKDAAVVKSEEAAAQQLRQQAEEQLKSATNAEVVGQSELAALASQRRRLEAARNWKDLSNV